MDRDGTAMTAASPKSGAQTGALELSGAEIVIRALKDQGVRHIFGYPGGAVLPIYDALFADDAIIHVLCRHEQGRCMRRKAMRARPAGRAWCS